MQIISLLVVYPDLFLGIYTIFNLLCKLKCIEKYLFEFFSIIEYFFTSNSSVSFLVNFITNKPIFFPVLIDIIK